MRQIVENLLDEYERGVIDRTQFVLTLAGMAVASRAPDTNVFRGKTLNHITLKVSNLERSREFYQEMFGIPVSNRTMDGYNLKFGDNFLGIYETENAGVMDHFCIGIEDFQFDAAMEKLKRGPAFMEPYCRGQRIYLCDPDGIRLQLAPVDFNGY